MLAYRDVAHYYFPLYQYTQRCWFDGQWPLWNHYEDTGRPLLADVTTAALYPGKLVLALPLDYLTNLNLFLGLHLLIAGWGICRIGQIWRWHPAATSLAAVSYALSGPVLSQVANPPYLIGAAWLPWLFLHLVQLSGGGVSRAGKEHESSRDGRTTTRQHRSKDLVAAAIFTTLIVLGGDLQTVYHAGLLSILLIVWQTSQSSPVWSDRLQNAVMPVSRMAGAFTLAGLLSAVQLLPAFEYARMCDRTDYPHPRNLYEWAAEQLTSGERLPLSVLWQIPEHDSHAARIYRFSVGPWHWPELVWPGITGRPYPIHTRWITRLPAEGDSWSPSLYAGLLVAILALGLPWRKRSRRRSSNLAQPLLWIALLSALAALGAYGLAGLWRGLSSISGQPVGEAAIDPAAGGLYWWLKTLLPGYAFFRYPAKWWTITQLALSLLAGIATQHLLVSRGRWPYRRMLLGVAAISFCAAVWMIANRQSMQAWLSQSPGDSIWGPLDATLTWQHAIQALLQATVVSLLGWSVLTASLSRRSISYGLTLLAGLQTADLWWANHWIPLNIPGSTIAVARVAGESSAAKPTGDSPVPIRVFRHVDPRWRPETWASQSSQDRGTELVTWDWQTRHPKYPLVEVPIREAVVGGHVSVRPAVVQHLLRLTGLTPGSLSRAASDEAASRRTAIDPRQVLNLLGIELYRGPDELPKAPLTPVPFCWIAHQTRLHPAASAGVDLRSDQWPELLAELARQPGTDSVLVSPQWAVTKKESSVPDRHKSLSAYPRPGTPGRWQGAGKIRSAAASNLSSESNRAAGTAQVGDAEVDTHPVALQAEDVQGETSEGLEIGSQDHTHSAPAESARCVALTPTSTIVAVKLQRPGWLVVNQLPCPGWYAQLRDASGRVQAASHTAVNGIMTGVPLPAGEFQIELRYAPNSVRLGGWLTLMTSLVLVAWSGLRWWPRRSEKIGRS